MRRIPILSFVIYKLEIRMENGNLTGMKYKATLLAVSLYHMSYGVIVLVLFSVDPGKGRVGHVRRRLPSWQINLEFELDRSADTTTKVDSF